MWVYINIQNRICNNSNSLTELENLETENILIDEKNYKDLVIYFTKYVSSKSIKILSLHYYELMGKIEAHERKKHLIAEDYMLGTVLDKIKEIIGIAKFDDAKILIDTNDKFRDDITFKKVVILITCVIKDGNKFDL